MIQQSKDKFHFYKKNFLKSFTKVSNINAVVEQSLEPLPELTATASTTLINLEPGSMPNEMTTPEEVRKYQKQDEATYASNLRVPPSPSWTLDMSADELNASEMQAFLHM